MISSVDGVAILKKWRRERVLVSFFALSTGDFASSWAAKIRAADGPILEVEMVGSSEIQRFNLARALFGDETPDDLPFNIEDLGKFSSFLFIRLADGLPISSRSRSVRIDAVVASLGYMMTFFHCAGAACGLAVDSFSFSVVT